MIVHVGCCAVMYPDFEVRSVHEYVCVVLHSGVSSFWSKGCCMIVYVRCCTVVYPDFEVKSVS